MMMGVTVGPPLDLSPDTVTLILPPGGTAGTVRIEVGEPITGDVFAATVRRTSGRDADVIATLTFANRDDTAGRVDMVVTAAASRLVADALARNPDGGAYRDGWWLLTRRVGGSGDPVPLAQGPVKVTGQAPAP